MRVDLNCDLDEAFGNHSSGGDYQIIPLITSASAACGFHTGDENMMNETVKLAKTYNVAVDAHPGLPDLKGFGRWNIDISNEETYNLMTHQLGALQGFCRTHQVKISYVKPHGTLYQTGAKDGEIASAVVQAVYDFDPSLVLVGSTNSHLISGAKNVGLITAPEVFVGRRYEDDGQLASRKGSDAVIIGIDEALEQALKMVKENKIISKNNKEVTLQVDTICVHGDGKHVLLSVSEIREILMKEGIDIQSL